MTTRVVAQAVAFVGWVVFESPALLPVLQDHLTRHDGEVFPHIAISEIRAWLKTEMETQGESATTVRIGETLRAGFGRLDFVDDGVLSQD